MSKLATMTVIVAAAKNYQNDNSSQNPVDTVVIIVTTSTAHYNDLLLRIIRTQMINQLNFTLSYAKGGETVNQYLLQSLNNCATIEKINRKG